MLEKKMINSLKMDSPPALESIQNPLRSPEISFDWSRSVRLCVITQRVTARLLACIEIIETILHLPGKLYYTMGWFLVLLSKPRITQLNGCLPMMPIMTMNFDWVLSLLCPLGHSAVATVELLLLRDLCGYVAWSAEHRTQCTWTSGIWFCEIKLSKYCKISMQECMQYLTLICYLGICSPVIVENEQQAFKFWSK